MFTLVSTSTEDAEPVVPLRERTTKVSTRDHVALNMLHNNPALLR
jgi:hypothetical protein